MMAEDIRPLRFDRMYGIRRSTTKTDARERVIPLNPEAWAVILISRGQAKLLFGTEPQADSYVFPHAEGLRKTLPVRAGRLGSVGRFKKIRFYAIANTAARICPQPCFVESGLAAQL